MYTEYDVAKQIPLEKLRPLMPGAPLWPPRAGSAVEAFWQGEGEGDEGEEAGWFNALVLRAVSDQSFEVYFPEYFTLETLDIASLRAVSATKVLCVCVRVCTCVHLCILVCTCGCISVCTCEYVCVFVCVCLFLCGLFYLCASVYVSVCVCVCE